eukprot:symbB.v1.2.017036.t1/scaffold1317.1/size125501/3
MSTSPPSNPEEGEKGSLQTGEFYSKSRRLGTARVQINRNAARPYFFVQVKRSAGGLETMRDILQQRFEAEGVIATLVEKEDLALEDHIVGKHRSLIKLSFQSTEGLNKARMNLFQEMKGKRRFSPPLSALQS